MEIIVVEQYVCALTSNQDIPNQTIQQIPQEVHDKPPQVILEDKQSSSQINLEYKMEELDKFNQQFLTKQFSYEIPKQPKIKSKSPFFNRKISSDTSILIDKTLTNNITSYNIPLDLSNPTQKQPDKERMRMTRRSQTRKTYNKIKSLSPFQAKVINKIRDKTTDTEHAQKKYSLNEYTITNERKKYSLNEFTIPNESNQEVPDILQHSIADKTSNLQQIYEDMKRTESISLTYTSQKSTHDIMYELNQEEVLAIDQECSLVMVTMYLPLSITRSPSSPSQNQPTTSFDITIPRNNYNNNLYLDLIKKYANLQWIAALPQDQYTQQEQTILTKLLQQKYNCYPLFIKSELLNQVQYDMYLKYLDLIINNIKVTLSQEQIQQSVKTLKQLSLIFANHILNQVSSESVVFVSDYRLFYVPYYLAYAFSKLTIGLFWNNCFPALEYYKQLPFGTEFIKTFLCCSNISFQCFSHAKNFFEVVNLLYGIQFQSLKGVIILLYMGRQITVRINSLYPNYSIIQDIQLTHGYTQVVHKWKSIVNDKYLIIGYDNMDEMNLIEINMEMVFNFTINHQSQSRQIMFIQCLQEDSYTDQAINNVYKQTKQRIRNKIQTYNQLLQRECFQFVEKSLNDQERIALFSIAHVLLRSQLKSTNFFRSFEFSLSSVNQGMVMCAEFGNFKKIWPTFYCFKILKEGKFDEKLMKIYNLKEQQIKEIKTSHLNKIKNITCLDWFQITMHDLKQSQSLLKYAHISALKKGTEITKIAHKNIYKPSVTDLQLLYISTTNRLIMLDVDGCLLKEENMLKRVINKPTKTLIDYLKSLTNDLRNTIYIITGQPVSSISSKFTNLPRLGILCEYGYMIREPSNPTFYRLFNMDWSWKACVKDKMDKYSEYTQGSEVIMKESSCVWKYSQVDKAFGLIQSEQLIIEIKTILIDYQDLDIVRCEGYVEIRPFGMNKGTITELLLQQTYEDNAQIDFVLMLGNGISDEEMFASLKSNLKRHKQYFTNQIKPYAIVVGKRPSNANYYLKDTNEVEELLKALVKSIN